MESFPGRVVCVDDEQVMRTLVREVFEQAGFRGPLTTCGSGQELLNRYRELQPDLILLDLLMPEMDGLETLEALADDADVENVNVVMVTAVKKLVMTPEYRKLGVIGVIHKPVDVKALFGQIEAIWNEREGVAEDSADAEA